MALVALAGREGPARGVWGSGRWECVYVLASAERVGELHVRMYMTETKPVRGERKRKLCTSSFQAHAATALLIYTLLSGRKARWALGNTPPRPKSQIGGLKSPHGPKSPVAELSLA